MKMVLVVCDAFKKQIEQVGEIPHDIIYLEQGLHQHPKILTNKLQEAINSVNSYELFYWDAAARLLASRPLRTKRWLFPGSMTVSEFLWGAETVIWKSFQLIPALIISPKAGWKHLMTP